MQQKYHHALNKMVPGFLHKKWTMDIQPILINCMGSVTTHWPSLNGSTMWLFQSTVHVALEHTQVKLAQFHGWFFPNLQVSSKYTQQYHISYPLLCYAFRGPSTPGNLTILALSHLRRVQRFPSGKHSWFSSQVTTTSEGPPGWKFFFENFEKIFKNMKIPPDGKGKKGFEKWH